MSDWNTVIEEAAKVADRAASRQPVGMGRSPLEQAAAEEASRIAREIRALKVL